MAHVRAYQPGDAESLSQRLRRADEHEVHAASGRSPLSALTGGAERSLVCCTIVNAAGLPIGMFGVVPQDDLTGTVWMLGSDNLTQPPIRRQFLRECRAWCDTLHRVRPLLFNLVDARNTAHIRWLKFMGFTFLKLHPEYGVERRPFWEFARLNYV